MIESDYGVNQQVKEMSMRLEAFVCHLRNAMKELEIKETLIEVFEGHFCDETYDENIRNALQKELSAVERASERTNERRQQERRPRRKRRATTNAKFSASLLLAVVKIEQKEKERKKAERLWRGLSSINARPTKYHDVFFFHCLLY